MSASDGLRAVLSIEFAGCTGTGKTTLARETRAVMESRGIPVFSPFELVFGRRARGLVRDERAQNVLLDVALFPFVITFCVRHSRVAWLLFSHLLFRPPPPIRAVARLRSLAGKMGIHVLHRLCGARPGVVLIDEGMLHSVHNVFVYTPTTASAATLEEFASQVPLCDLTVILTASVDDIVVTTATRLDPPVRNAESAWVAESARRAIAMFDALSCHERIRRVSAAIRMGPGGMTQSDAALRVTERASAMLRIRQGR